MSRTIFLVADVLSAPSLLLLDSAAKGVVLLMLASALAIILRRDSAATRHLVWLLAMVALLAVPVLSAMLPEWRVLPRWAKNQGAGIQPATTVAATSPPFMAGPAMGAFEMPQNAPNVIESPSAFANQPAAAQPDSRLAPVTSETISESAIWNWNRLDALPLVWAIGFCLLMLRLLAARWMLWNTERQGMVIGPLARGAGFQPAKNSGEMSGTLEACTTGRGLTLRVERPDSESQATLTGHDTIAMALEAVCSQLGMRRPVTLLIHPDKTIPVVWGILRCRLLLPAAAQHWSGEQLRSVLLHEIAHIKRRDTMAQLLTQTACALHWFNPLVWFAAWRLGVERERACDDLVLASGVRPSAYAGHLLEVVTGLSPARWTQVGLAMARKSSLEGRLAAVLSESLNRRRVSAALAAIALTIAVGIAVPIAMLRAADENWSPPQAAHVGGSDFSTYCVYNGESAAFVIAYHGDFGSSTSSSSNSKSRTWHDEATLTLLTTAGKHKLTIRRDHTAPDMLTVAGNDYDLKHGRLLLLNADGTVRQFAIEAPAVTDGEAARKLAKQIAAIPPQAREIALKPKLPKLPDEAYTKTGVHCQKFREEDAKRPGGELMGNVMESRSEEDPLVLGMRVASDAKWNIGGQARVELVVRSSSRSDVKFPQTPRADNGLSVVAIDKDGKEHQAEIAQFDGLLTLSHLRLPPFYMVMVKSFTLRFDPEKRGVSEPGVAAFHLPPGEYKLRCKWSDASPEVAHEGEWTGELISIEHKFKLTAAAATATEAPQTPAASEPAQKVGPKLPGRVFVNAGLRTAKDDKRFTQSVIAIDPTSGTWTRLENVSKSGFTVPLSPVRVSPDGRTMLFMREKEIWKCDAITGENAVRVFQKGQPKAWAPDGKEFIAVVEKNGEGPASSENWRVSTDGEKQLRLSLSIGEVVEDWSSDGRWLLGWSHADGQLYIMQPDGSDRRRLTNSNRNASRNEHPRFSPDGRRMVYLQTLYQGNDDVPRARYSLRTINLDGTDDREILGETAVAPAPAKATWTAPMGARWSPDGKHLAVALFDHDRSGGIMAINGNWRLAILDAEGGKPRELKLEGVLTTVLPWDGPEWRPAAPGQAPGNESPLPAVPKPKEGAKLNPATEKRLQWGKPVNGLRGAIVIRHAADEPKAGDLPDLYLVVQNVSEAPIRLTDANVPPNVDLRVLYLKIDGNTKWGVGARVPELGDLMLQPREVAYLIMLPSRKNPDEPRAASIIAEGAIKDPRQTLIAELTIEQAPRGAWTGKLVTGETSGAAAAGNLQPKSKGAQVLFKMWQDNARKNGNIPGGLVGRLGDKVKEFIRNNTGDASGDPYAKKMTPLVPRFDSARDWTPDEVVALMDDIAAVTTIPLETTLEEAVDRTFRTGAPLPQELASAPWGEAQPNGLRMAWLLEPRAAEHRLGTPLKSSILFHNSGKDAVVFRTRTWHQGDHKASGINVSSLFWTTIGRLLPFRLAPGEFVEVTGAGIGVGPMSNDEDWQGTRVGSWIEAKEGDEVTFMPDAVPLSDWNEAPPPAGQPGWWLDFIAARLALELPLPAAADERKPLLDRVMRDLFGTAPTTEETAAFLADRDPKALESLAKRLASRAGLTSFSGPLTSGTTRFRVLPADPDAAKKPRTASNPGRYTLGENIRLDISRRPDGTRTVNEASIQFFSPDPTRPAPGEPHEIQLPDGYNTWAAAWVRGGTVLWVLQKNGLRSYDFTNAAQVKETPHEGPADLEKVPPPILDALRAALDVPGVSKPATAKPRSLPK